VSQYLVITMQVAQISPAEVAAGRTGTALLQRSHITGISGIAEIHSAPPGEGHSVASHACRHHAIEEVHAQGNRTHQPLRVADAQQMARLTLGQDTRLHLEIVMQ
jgi:hypothetical protein